MAEYRIKETGEIIADLARAFPNVSIPMPPQPDDLDALGVDPVFEGPQAQPGRYQVAYRDGVEEIDGKWFTKYAVVDMDANAIAAIDEAQAEAVRRDRNRRLADLDWTQGKDIPDEISVPAAEKRQALRDVPDQPGFPWEVVWP